MSFKRLLPALALVASLALFAAACGEDENESSASSGGESSEGLSC